MCCIFLSKQWFFVLFLFLLFALGLSSTNLARSVVFAWSSFFSSFFGSVSFSCCCDAICSLLAFCVDAGSLLASVWICVGWAGSSDVVSCSFLASSFVALSCSFLVPCRSVVAVMMFAPNWLAVLMVEAAAFYVGFWLLCGFIQLGPGVHLPCRDIERC
ncbi:hypothetical protein U1Q18_038716 [Sarracenia purpurea var. burkii]